jgi:hypothetical protein
MTPACHLQSRTLDILDMALAPGATSSSPPLQAIETMHRPASSKAVTRSAEAPRVGTSPTRSRKKAVTPGPIRRLAALTLRMTSAARILTLVAFCSLGGCEGQILAPQRAMSPSSPAVKTVAGANAALPDGSTDPLSSDVQAIAQSQLCTAKTVGVRAPMRALTPVQFEKSITALFDGHVSAPKGYPSQVGASLTGYSTDASLNTLSGGFAEGLNTVAEEIGLSVVDHLSEILSCASSANRACATQFVDTYAARAFRRPLPKDEQSALLALYDEAIADHGDFGVAIGELAAAIVQHPLFVYLPELGALEGTQRKLDDYELASRLSFMLWNSPPDAELLQAAAAKKLGSTEGLNAQTARMLKDARFSDVLRGFVREWLGFKDLAADAKDKAKYPSFDAELASAMNEELDRFVSLAVGKGPGGFQALIAGRDTFVNPNLAALYGITPPASGWKQVTLGEDRLGILGRAGVLAHFAGPTEPSHVRRGKVVRTAMLCDKVPVPPPGAAAMQPSYPAEANTRRKRSAILQQTSPCGGCHKQLDPIGLAFDDFDAIGKRISGTVDLSGNILGDEEMGGTFTGSRELSQRMSESDQVKECMGRQWFRYAYGRVEESADACSFAHMATDLGKTNGDLRSLFASATAAPGFRYRIATEN